MSIVHRIVGSWIATNVRQTLHAGPDGLVGYDAPIGDQGLFGPNSMCWKVHGDLPSMLIGGIAALMFQTAHPLAMAGVAQHSRYKQDPLGRFQRTARFIAGTTFGPMPLVDELIAKVRAVHLRVVGVSANGTTYAASDPRLLTFVHTTEAWSFLSAYQRYAPSPLLRAEKDQYLSEVAEIARLLGAREVPTSVASVRAYFAHIQPELHVTAEAREAIAFLLTGALRAPVQVFAHKIVADAAIDVLPRFVRSALNLSIRPGTVAITRTNARLFGAMLRWSIGPSVVAQLANARITAVHGHQPSNASTR